MTASGRARSQASSKPEAKPSIQFLSDKDIESSFTLEELLHQTARLVVRNDLATDQKVEVRFSPLVSLEGAESLPTPEPATPLPLIEGPKIVKARTLASFALSIDRSAVSQLGASGRYGGVITLVSDQPKTVPLWRQFQIIVPPVRLQISKATIFARRNWPFGSFDRFLRSFCFRYDQNSARGCQKSMPAVSLMGRPEESDDAVVHRPCGGHHLRVPPESASDLVREKQ